MWESPTVGQFGQANRFCSLKWPKQLQVAQPTALSKWVRTESRDLQNCEYFRTSEFLVQNQHGFRWDLFEFQFAFLGMKWTEELMRARKSHFQLTISSFRHIYKRPWTIISGCTGWPEIKLEFLAILKLKLFLKFKNFGERVSEDSEASRRVGGKTKSNLSTFACSRTSRWDLNVMCKINLVI